MPQPRHCCTIELSGSFNLNWADYLQDMQVNEQVEQGTVRKTTLVGQPRDLEACLGPQPAPRIARGARPLEISAIEQAGLL